jgi:formate dehydrogenase major subunit
LFNVVEYQEPVERPDVRYPFTRTTGRNHYYYYRYYRTRTMTGRSPGFNGLALKGEREINPADVAKLDVAQGELV